MDAQSRNTLLAPYVRWFFLVVALIVTFGSCLFIVPDLIHDRWPWNIPPFNARFMGGVYLSELVAVIILIVSNRWAPARIALPMALSFTFFVTLVSFIYHDKFDTARPITYIWFFLYIGSVLISGFFLWRYRRLPPANPTPPPAVWRIYLWVQAAVLALYGFALLFLPDFATSFWPWKFDNFHAQLYCAVFITGGIGSYLLSRAAAPLEYLTLGLSQAVLGLCSIVGLYLADAVAPAARKIDWSKGGTFLWLGFFGVLFLAGLGLIWQSRIIDRVPAVDPRHNGVVARH